MTCFLRALRGIESDVDDSFTVILQYDGPQKDLLVTVKTNIASALQDQLKYFIRGTKGSYVKVCMHASSLELSCMPLLSLSLSLTLPLYSPAPIYLFYSLATKF